METLFKQIDKEIIEYTEEEYKQQKLDEEMTLSRWAQEELAKTKRVEAETKLAALGLTADDLKALGL